MKYNYRIRTLSEKHEHFVDAGTVTNITANTANLADTVLVNLTHISGETTTSIGQYTITNTATDLDFSPEIITEEGDCLVFDVAAGSSTPFFYSIEYKDE